MNPWSTNPSWQNFSSLVREATTAREVKSGVELSHHLTAALYFGIAALEAFINDRTRVVLAATKSDEEIFTILRTGRLRGRNDRLLDKLALWPEVLLGRPLVLRDGTLDRIELFNEIRGNLTHPKTHGRDIYAQLEAIDPSSIVDTVAEYIAQYHREEGTHFPYWLWGWNYLNPSPLNHEIMLMNAQQFVFSMMYIGFNVNAGSISDSEGWQDTQMRDYPGFKRVAEVLEGLNYCEPKFDRFPFQPKLCRRWWTPEHHQSCGFVTRDAIDFANNYRPEHQS